MKPEFSPIFKNLTGNEPFPWQEALYESFIGDRNKIPSCCDLPTGLGKTSIVALWLIALAKLPPGQIPRRLVYVVNRRTVVDQTTVEVEKYRKNLAKPELAEMKAALQKLCALPTDSPLALSTLRGQYADNREWSADPCRPAVIVGTVDMIGSRLLFSGYGASYKTKPLFAGFLGQDVLLVHDEAHLEPAFQTLLKTIESEQAKANDKDARKIKIIELSATPRGDDPPFRITEADEQNAEIQRRLFAIKQLILHELPAGKKLPEELSRLALDKKNSGRAVIVFARSVDDVEKVAANLEAKVGAQNVARLTGTMRGLERDRLVETKLFQRFFPTAPEEKGATAYLVCTSAGEVGINISAHHLVCDLSTFESMAQRFGRVNRFGKWDDTEIDVVYPAPDDFEEKDERDKRRQLTLKLLQQLKGDASPKALSHLDRDERIAAFSPPPAVLPATDILFDAWSLTSIEGRLPGRPKVEPYLHGIVDYEPPQTQVAWREEVDVITPQLLPFYPPKKLEEFLEDYPLKPHEILQDRSDRVLKRLEELLDDKNREHFVWLIDDGAVELHQLGELVAKSKKDKTLIDDCLLLLPPTLGGLREGMLDGKAENNDSIKYDVADQWLDQNNQPRRERIWDQDHPTDQKMRLVRKIDLNPGPDDEENEDATPTGKQTWYWYEAPRSADAQGSATAPQDVLLEVHTTDVAAHARHFASQLQLPPELQTVLTLAAKLHDSGKAREVWQRSIGNLQGPALAKSRQRMNVQLLEGYRHEFGSLLDATQSPELKALSEDQQNLVLHLIAAHHGRARPHFPTDEAFDPEGHGLEALAMAQEVPRRFARLQQRYGRWGLAWLESLLRAADYAASANPSKTVEDKS
jgi:CRISPR-associated endonuclease/helicase Cas3